MVRFCMLVGMNQLDEDLQRRNELTLRQGVQKPRQPRGYRPSSQQRYIDSKSEPLPSEIVHSVARCIQFIYGRENCV